MGMFVCLLSPPDAPSRVSAVGVWGIIEFRLSV